MKIKAKILADSIGPARVRLTTWELTYPRFIHAEIMTYGMFARNAASSRAIPVKKMMSRIWNNPVMPVHWGMNQPGMSARKELSGWRKSLAMKVWVMGSVFALLTVWLLNKLGVHKQIANRVSEPWMYITTVVTADQFALSNMFHQRDHDDAQPEFRDLARHMWAEYNLSKPKELKVGEWHLPFVTEGDRQAVALSYPGDLYEETLKKLSVGRCARVSYLNHNGHRDLEGDEILHDKMRDAKPMHASPFEHIAKALTLPATQAKYHGWRPYRMDIANENLTELKEWVPSEYTKEIWDQLLDEDK